MNGDFFSMRSNDKIDNYVIFVKKIQYCYFCYTKDNAVIPVIQIITMLFLLLHLYYDYNNSNLLIYKMICSECNTFSR